MFKYVVGTRDPDPVPPEAQRPGITVHDVNLIGEYNIAGEFWHVLPLFDELGLRFAEISRIRELIDALADLACAQGYGNVDEFAAYVARKLVKKVHHRREYGGNTA